MGMENLFELEAPVCAPRFRSVVACLRLFFRPADIASRGATRAELCSPWLFFYTSMPFALSCFITGRSLFLIGYRERTLI